MIVRLESHSDEYAVLGRLSSFVQLSDDVMALHGGESGLHQEAMRDAVRMFRTLQVPFALIGAHAVAVNVKEHRSTEDIDIVAPSAHLQAVCERSQEFGFSELPKDADATIRSFRHRGGGRLDIIFDDSGGFANLDAVQMIHLKGIGEIPVAAAIDIAYSKLRAQRRDWLRQEEKRATDFADLVAMLREKPELARQLQDRIPIPHVQWHDSTHTIGSIDMSRRSIDMSRRLREACIQAGIDIPTSATGSSINGWLNFKVIVAALFLMAILWALFLT